MTRLLRREAVSVAPGAVHVPDWLDPAEQRALVAACIGWADREGGFRAPRMRNGSPMSARMVGLGWHWYPYRYSRALDDSDGRPAGPFPDRLGRLARRALRDAAAIDARVTGGDGGEESRGPGSDWYEPDVALVNWYGSGARMGMHVDRDERCSRPVVSISLGDSALFRWGRAEGRGRPWVDLPLESGDLFVFGGPARLSYHGVQKIVHGTGDPGLGIEGARINITIRQTGLE